MAERSCTTRDSHDHTARGAAVAIIERGNAEPSPLQDGTHESDEQQLELLRRLAIELGRSVDA